MPESLYSDLLEWRLIWQEQADDRAELAKILLAIKCQQKTDGR
jgi:hypothetical protein